MVTHTWHACNYLPVLLDSRAPSGPWRSAWHAVLWRWCILLPLATTWIVSAWCSVPVPARPTASSLPAQSPTKWPQRWGRYGHLVLSLCGWCGVLRKAPWFCLCVKHGNDEGNKGCILYYGVQAQECTLPLDITHAHTLIDRGPNQMLESFWVISIGSCAVMMMMMETVVCVCDQML